MIVVAIVLAVTMIASIVWSKGIASTSWEEIKALEENEE